MGEVFPKLCLTNPDSYRREDRKDELWQNALVEQRLYFIRKVNLWLESGRLIDSPPALAALGTALLARLTSGDPALLDAFNQAVAHPNDFRSDADRADHMTQEYRPVTTRCISLPSFLQPLTAGARIVNSRSYLIDKMDIGYENAKRFVRTLPYGGLPTCGANNE